jgi:hypothetical protein
VVAVDVTEGKDVDCLVIRGRNGDCGVNVRVQLDPSYIANDFGQDMEKQAGRNKDRLLKVLAAFDLATCRGKDVVLDRSKFGKAVGSLFSFSIQGAGKLNDKGNEMYNISFKGAVKELLPVAAPSGAGGDCPLGGAAANASGTTDDGDCDIPF